METPTTVFSHCQVCRSKLEHTALFCPQCGASACSWECYVRHLSAHAREPAPATGPPKEGRDLAAALEWRGGRPQARGPSGGTWTT